MAENAKVTPKPLAPSMVVNGTCLGLVVLGAAAFVATLFTNKDRAWHAYLTAYMYFFIIAIGGLFFASIQHLTKAGWSVNIRRFSEALTSYIPVAAVGAIGIFFGGKSLYEWFDHVKVADDELLTHKASYLNPTFFAIRLIVFFGLWLLFSKKLVGFSTKQDETGDESLTQRTIGWSIGFLLTFAISLLLSVDLVMSLNPHWFSTIFGVYLFGGMFQSTMAVTILLIQYCQRRGLLEGWVNENHMHDLGKFMFAFTVFWAYICYSQYMLIWYANLPEETIFYLPRVTGSWMYVSIFLVLFKFVVPFLALLSRRAKRNPTTLAAIAILLLIMQYVDLYWLIFPNLDPKSVIFGLPEIGVWLGFAGAFTFTVMRFLSKHPIVPVKDPRIAESLHHHVVY